MRRTPLLAFAFVWQYQQVGIRKAAKCLHWNRFLNDAFAQELTCEHVPEKDAVGGGSVVVSLSRMG